MILMHIIHSCDESEPHFTGVDSHLLRFISTKTVNNLMSFYSFCLEFCLDQV